MDHNAIRIYVTGCLIIPRKPIYREVIRKVRVQSDEEIGLKLSELSDGMIHKYSENGTNATDIQVDSVADELYKTIKNGLK